MAWTAPSTRATLYVVTAATWNNELVTNTKLLRDQATAMRAGTGWTMGSLAGSFNADLGFSRDSDFFCDYTTASGSGTPQMRVYGSMNITALGAATSITLTIKCTVALASDSSGNINTVKSIYSPTAYTTTGGKFFDSGFLDLSALTTDFSGYGIMLLSPQFRIDENSGGGADPTISNLSCVLEPRIA